MKKMILMATMLMLAGQHVNSMDKKGWDIEQGLNVQSDVSGTLTVIPDQVKVFGASGNKIEPGSTALKYKPKKSDQMANNQLRMVQQHNPKVEYLFVNCPANTVQFGQRVQRSEFKGASSIDLSIAINSIPHHISYKNQRGQLEQISGAAYVANLLVHITRDDYGSVRTQLSLLQGDKGIKLMQALKLVIDESKYNNIVNMNVNWAEGITGTLSTLMAQAQKQAEKIAKNLQGQAGQFAQQAGSKMGRFSKEAKVQALNSFQRFNKAFTKAVGAWGGIAIGSSLTAVLMYYFIIRSK